MAYRSTRPNRKRRFWRTTLVATLLLALVVLAGRAALPSYLKSYVNRTLDESPDYDGRIGSVDVHLWRGAYSIHEVKIVKTTHAVPVPFFECPRLDFSLDWRALVNGAARGNLAMQQPKLNFVHGPSDEQSQTGVNQPWIAIIEKLYPFRIDRAEIHEGEIHFHAFHTEPRVDVYMSNVDATVENLTNVKDSLDPLIATLRGRAVAMHSEEGGQFDLEMRFDPQSHRPNFDLAARLLDLDVTKINALTQAYGDFDFERGRFDLVVELTTKDGFLDGYAKPLFRDVTVLSLREIESDDPLQLFWEALVGVVGEVFKNQPRDQFGTRITLEGDFDNPSTSLLEIVSNVLRNAFVRAYMPRVERGLAEEDS